MLQKYTGQISQLAEKFQQAIIYPFLHIRLKELLLLLHIQPSHTRQASSVYSVYPGLYDSYPYFFHLIDYSLCTPPHENRRGFHPFTSYFFHCLLVSGVNKTVPCSVSVPISSTLVDFTIVPDFNVQLSPIKLYGSTTVLAPITVA